MNSSIKVFFVICSALLLMGFIYSLEGTKGDLVLLLDDKHTPVLDVSFRFLTFLGDGTWFAILIPLFLFIRYSYAISFAGLGIIQLLLVQGLKRNVFGRLPRPAEYFKDMHQFQNVEGIDIHHFYSFPSGHTATAFGIATLLVLLFRPRTSVVVGIIIVATLVGISRIYLAQHFLEDVLAGSVLGILSAILIWWGYQKIERRSPASKLFTSSLRDIF